jgi:hypothetical protein
LAQVIRAYFIAAQQRRKPIEITVSADEKKGLRNGDIGIL